MGSSTCMSRREPVRRGDTTSRRDVSRCDSARPRPIIESRPAVTVRREIASGRPVARLQNLEVQSGPVLRPDEPTRAIARPAQTWPARQQLRRVGIARRQAVAVIDLDQPAVVARSCEHHLAAGCRRDRRARYGSEVEASGKALRRAKGSMRLPNDPSAPRRPPAARGNRMRAWLCRRASSAIARLLLDQRQLRVERAGIGPRPRFAAHQRAAASERGGLDGAAFVRSLLAATRRCRLGRHAD